MLRPQELAIQHIKIEELLGITQLRSVAASWHKASLGKRILIAGVVSAVAVGVFLAIGFGVPPEAAIAALRCTYEIGELASLIYQVGSSMFNAVCSFFKSKEIGYEKAVEFKKLESEAHKPVLSFMKAMQAQKLESFPLAAAAA